MVFTVMRGAAATSRGRNLDSGHYIAVIHRTAVLQYTVDTRYTDTHNNVT